MAIHMAIHGYAHVDVHVNTHVNTHIYTFANASCAHTFHVKKSGERGLLVLASVVMAYIVMAYIVMAYTMSRKTGNEDSLCLTRGTIASAADWSCESILPAC